MLPPILTDILLGVVAAGVLWLCVRELAGAGGAETLTRLDARIEEHLKRLMAMEQRLGELREELRLILAEHGSRFEQRQGEAIKHLSEILQAGMTQMQKQIGEHLARYGDEIGKRIDALTQKTDQRLLEIGGLVEKRLTEGFEKTTQTFGDVLKRLALIDEAQKRITELSSNVVSLQEVLADKGARGAFGEVQLAALVRNMLPENHFSLQHTLSNGKKVDCLLFLPPPSGDIAIDAKFPLEAYKVMTGKGVSDAERKAAERQFKLDIQKHIDDIAGKYIIPGETADGAVMFIPAEAVFAEIHAHHPELIERAHRSRVWLVSPTTLMAVLTTLRSVIKDAATREQVHIIQEHLGKLAKDFERFQKRMDSLAQHIGQAHQDVEDVNISARKITSQFQKIEQVELPAIGDAAPRELPADKPGGDN